MDGARFDRWTRLLAADPASRRGALRLLAGGALGAVLARLGAEGAVAQDECLPLRSSCSTSNPSRCCSGHCSRTTSLCCLPASNKCKKGTQCCSTLCKGPTGKKKCRCNDGRLPCKGVCCATGETCRNGTCGKDCQVNSDCGTSTRCQDRVCDENNRCTIVNKQLGTQCDDSTICNGRETCDGNGNCRLGSPLVCDDGNPCTSNTCHSSLGCQFPAVTDGTSCSTSTVPSGGKCRQGTCVAPPVCQGNGGNCFGTGGCCSGTCGFLACTCSDPGEPCFVNSDCCNGRTCVAYQCR